LTAASDEERVTRQETTLAMKNQRPQLDHWQFEANEVSAGVYVLEAQHTSGAQFRLQGAENDGGEAFLSAYADAVERSMDMNTLHNLDNWSVSIRKTSVGIYMVDAKHQLGPTVSFGASGPEDAATQLHAYASELEKAIEDKRRQV
jgi:hypothetical protein